MVHAEASARGRRARSADAMARQREQQRVYRQERRSTPEGLARDRQIMRDAKRRAREVRAQQRAEDGVEQQMLLAHNASGSRIVANARRIPGVRWHCGEGSSAHERARRDVKEDIETFVHVPLDDKLACIRDFGARANVEMRVCGACSAGQGARGAHSREEGQGGREGRKAKGGGGGQAGGEKAHQRAGPAAGAQGPADSRPCPTRCRWSAARGRRRTASASAASADAQLHSVQPAGP